MWKCITSSLRSLCQNTGVWETSKEWNLCYTESQEKQDLISTLSLINSFSICKVLDKNFLSILIKPTWIYCRKVTRDALVLARKRTSNSSRRSSYLLVKTCWQCLGPPMPSQLVQETEGFSNGKTWWQVLWSMVWVSGNLSPGMAHLPYCWDLNISSIFPDF